MKKTIIAAVLATSALSFNAMAEEAKLVGDAGAGQGSYAVCMGCHGAQGEGGVGPQLAGQKEEDIVAKLHLYKSGEQVGPMTSMMAPMATGLTDQDIANIAAYVASL